MAPRSLRQGLVGMRVNGDRLPVTSPILGGPLRHRPGRAFRDVNRASPPPGSPAAGERLQGHHATRGMSVTELRARVRRKETTSRGAGGTGRVGIELGGILAAGTEVDRTKLLT
jgi:hypothetical protein